MNSITELPIPAHVPPHLVRDLDLFRIPDAETDIHNGWKKLQDEYPDLVYAPRYGGYWVPMRGRLLDQVWSDHRRFRSGGGITIPHLDIPPQLPVEADEPEHKYFRSPINLALSPRKLQELTNKARSLAIELIENIRRRGECEFVKDFASHMPMTVFLSMMDLPLDDRERLIAKTETMLRTGDEQARVAANAQVFAYLSEWLHVRLANPGADLISQILKVKVDGKPITFDQALSECALVLFGGLDTVAATMAFIARYLATHPDIRRQLVADPSLIPLAVDEFIRRHPLPTLARQATEDVDLDGVTIKQGDYVMLSTHLHGLDDRVWTDPLEIDLARNTRELMSFGKGIHRCPGANLARAEIRIFLEEWLKRIPDFAIPAGGVSPTLSGTVAGVMSLPLTWEA